MKIRQTKNRRRLSGAFTLIEMVLVLAIIALLVGGAIRLLSGVGEEAKRVRVKGDLEALNNALVMYQSKGLQFPSSEQGLKALVTRPSSAPVPREWAPMMEEVPLDPWGQEYYYVRPGKHNPTKFDIGSAGPDLARDTEDDVGNWYNK